MNAITVTPTKRAELSLFVVVFPEAGNLGTLLTQHLLRLVVAPAAICRRRTVVELIGIKLGE